MFSTEQLRPCRLDMSFLFFEQEPTLTQAADLARLRKRGAELNQVCPTAGSFE